MKFQFNNDLPHQRRAWEAADAQSNGYGHFSTLLS